ncbi:RNA polymerase-binding protein DksA [Schlegelella sp. S2-27]|uniref:RNA polymerase-binding transcription factor DksA n=1 Tax=Caldimonas mangrovi TaxID=2944811 RepID=A0ABT0YIC2_9BURK|nr:RNA polymerase-binding protein DksA [Caldimonas mangrovi]
MATAGKKAAASAKAPAKAASTQSPPAKAPKASAAPARKPHVDSPEPVSTSKAPTAKSAAKPAPAKTAGAPAASKPAAAKAAAPAPAAAAPAPHPVVSSPSPAKASFASSLAERASSSAIMNKTPVTAVLDQPRPAAAPADPKLANAWKTKAGRDLTDAEVLAMPEAEYMSDKQLEFFRTKLERLKDDLLSNAGETTEHLREDTSIVPDPADRATIEEEHALELRTRDRERKLLKKISQALTRIDAGDYGFCDETGEPIGLGRLIARPTATLSLEAQQRRELKQKMFGD